MTREAENELLCDMDITDDDVYAAMQRIPGYVDVSVGDCMEIYRFAQAHAKRRSLEQIRAGRLMHKSFMPLKSNQRLDEAVLIMARNSG